MFSKATENSTTTATIRQICYLLTNNPAPGVVSNHSKSELQLTSLTVDEYQKIIQDNGR